MRTPSNRTGPGYQGVVVSKPDIPSASSIGRSNCAASPLLVLAILPLTVRIGRSEGWAATPRRHVGGRRSDAAPANAAVTAAPPRGALCEIDHWFSSEPCAASPPGSRRRAFLGRNIKFAAQLQSENVYCTLKQFYL